MTPGFRDDLGLQSHSREPRSGGARRGISQPTCANESFGNWLLTPAVEKFIIWREISRKLARWNSPLITQIHFRERVAVIVFDVSRHVETQEHRRTGIYGTDSITRDKVTSALRKHDCLLPLRAGLSSWSRDLVLVFHFDGDEILSPDYNG